MVMQYFRDIGAALKGDLIALDKTEAAIIGAPAGETFSYFAAFEQKHGRWWAHLACIILWLVQAHHCRDQLLSIRMSSWNYARAAVLVLAPVGLVYLVLHWVGIL